MLSSATLLYKESYFRAKEDQSKAVRSTFDPPTLYAIFIKAPAIFKIDKNVFH
jgi:hypothetical protein